MHRDLKPEDVWLEPNRGGGDTVKVLDFGVVKIGDLADPAAWSRTAAVPLVDPAENETIFVPAAEADAVTSAFDALTRFGSIPERRSTCLRNNAAAVTLTGAPIFTVSGSSPTGC